MRYLLLALLFAACACTPAKIIMTDSSLELNSINIIDRNGFSETIGKSERLKQYEAVDFTRPQPYQKVLRVFCRDPDGDIHAIMTSYHPNGQLKQHLHVVNNRAYGAYKEYHPSGILKVEAFIIGGSADLTESAAKSWLFDGVCKAWDEDGRLQAEMSYKKGVQEGFSLYYHENGKLWKRVPFSKGEIEGTFEIYLEDGSLLQTSIYTKSERHGPTLRYWGPEKIAAEESYCDGKLLEGTYYDQCGKIITQITKGSGFRAIFGRDCVNELHEYKNGVQEGLVKIFSRGKLVRTYYLQNTIKHGEEIEYFTHIDPPQPKLLINWYQGKIQGLVKTWYEDGRQESQREMSSNHKNGVYTAWYKNGSLMLIEEYDANNLVKGEYYRKNDKIPVSQITQGKGIATLFDPEGNFIRKVNYNNGKPDE